MNSTPFPQFVGAPFSLYNDTNYMGNCGRSEKFPPIDRKIMRYAERGNKAHRMMAPRSIATAPSSGACSRSTASICSTG